MNDKKALYAKAIPNEFVEFKVDDEEPNKVGAVLGVTFDGCNQIFYTIQDMDPLEDGSCYIFESVEEKDIARVLPDDEDFEETIKDLKNKLIKEL